MLRGVGIQEVDNLLLFFLKGPTKYFLVGRDDWRSAHDEQLHSVAQWFTLESVHLGLVFMDGGVGV